MAEKWDGVAFLKNRIEAIDQQWVENVRKTKFFRVGAFNLPHMEPQLRQVYMDTYFITMMGFWNVSIIMQGVLLETLVKEIIFAKEKKEFQKPFGDAIDRCEKKGYLSDEEIRFLRRFKDEIRNPYQHVDVKKIVGESKVRAWKISLKKGKVAESLLKGVEKVFREDAGHGELKGYEDMRPVGVVIKDEIDRRLALPLFGQVEKLVRSLSTKHFKV
ncbi:MAG: hypothetical protein OEY39_01100 [Candidatus Bathyarchaeota archaeon]|nr:hypothetical protein [Candidatus Bathyarchaeota archaeon]MDH5623052.1 hypothetical protein [Candidatus Bathyarchaeota archaeon]MDH5635360.1 hypothetical protein [Candidatus Bathyarchaeota archaeon]MDH5701179.1 hypothetical protein [Candidatus Bathyarchaeota archaeon]